MRELQPVRNRILKKNSARGLYSMSLSKIASCSAALYNPGDGLFLAGRLDILSFTI